MESSVSRKSRSAADSRLQDELQAIDTSLLDKLIEIRAEHTRLADYRDKGDGLKDRVKEAVWKRVLSDYAARAAALEKQAAPLKVEVQREYRKLRALRDRVAKVNEEARLAKEELEFREAVGELTKDELKDRLAGPQLTLDGCKRDLAAIEGTRAKFVEAFGSEDDLEAITDPAIPAPQAATTGAAGDPASGASGGADMTNFVSPDATRLADGVVGAAEADAGEADGERTFILPRAAVLVIVDDTEPVEYRLAAINYFGRLEENQVQIARPGVSRRHAVIEASPKGFTLKDLGSQNGTFLNGEKVAEQPLADGDQIVIGDAKITYRIPWPPGDAGAVS